MHYRISYVLEISYTDFTRAEKGRKVKHAKHICTSE